MENFIIGLLTTILILCIAATFTAVIYFQGAYCGLIVFVVVSFSAVIYESFFC